MDVKNIKSHLQWWEKHESMFSTIAFLACQILGIVQSQRNENDFFKNLILINLRRCHLQSNYLKF